MLFFFEHHGIDSNELFRVHRLQFPKFPSHMHRAFELIFLNSGSLSLQVDQKNYVLHKNDLAFIFCNQIHSFSATDESDIIILLFSPEMIGDFYSTYKNSIPNHNIIHLDRTIDFSVLHSVYAQKSILYHICDLLLSNTSMSPASDRAQLALLQQIFAYVDNNRNCSLKTVSKALQYDYAYLSKLFIRFTGVHFTEYLNRYRIAQACYLLKNERRTVSEIASSCGYSTLRTFHRNFKRITGFTPREYLGESDNNY